MYKNITNLILMIGLYSALIMNAQTDISKALNDFINAEFIEQEEVPLKEMPVKKSGIKEKIWTKFTPKKARETLNNTRKKLSNREKAKLAVTFLENSENKTSLPYAVINALELVKGQSEKSLITVFNQLTHLNTMIGKITFAKTLVSPTTNINALKEKQLIIKTINDNEVLCKTFEENIKKFKKSEESLYEFFSSNPLVSPVESKLVYSRFSAINNSPLLYNLATIIPATLITFSVPAIFFGLSVVVYRTMSAYINPIVDAQTIARLKKEEKDDTPENRDETRAEIIKESYTPLSKAEVEELYKKLKSKNVAEKNQASFDLKSNSITTVFRKTIDGEKVSLLDCAKLNKKILELTAPKTLLIWQGTPVVFFAARQISELSIIAKKAQELQTYLFDIARVVEISETLWDIIRNNTILRESTFGISLAQFIDNTELYRLTSLLKKSTFRGNPSTISNWGTIFATFKEMEKQKNHFIPLIKTLGEIDMYTAIASIMKQHTIDNKNNVRFCFADFIETKNTPTIHAVEFWNPFILSHKKFDEIITNSVQFDIDNQHGILTGPNTCGKTTVIVGLMLNAILAQTFGIAAAKNYTLTPFDIFNVTLTISTNGAIGDSRFKAEIREAQYILDTVKQAQLEGKLCLTIQDEIFTGTNQEDGSVAAYDFLQKLGKYKNNIILLATHYSKLTTLESPYANFKINAEVVDKAIIRYYTIEKGISNLNIARLLTEKAGLV